MQPIQGETWVIMWLKPATLGRKDGFRMAVFTQRVSASKYLIHLICLFFFQIHCYTGWFLAKLDKVLVD